MTPTRNHSLKARTGRLTLTASVVLAATAGCGGAGTDPGPGPEPEPEPPPPPAAATTATYRVVFEATWSASTHPTNFPGGAHFSPLIGAVHNDNITFWARDGTATPGSRAWPKRAAPPR